MFEPDTESQEKEAELLHHSGQFGFCNVKPRPRQSSRLVPQVFYVEEPGCQCFGDTDWLIVSLSVRILSITLIQHKHHIKRSADLSYVLKLRDLGCDCRPLVTTRV